MLKLEVDESLLENGEESEYELIRVMRFKELFQQTEYQWLEVLEKITCGSFEMYWNYRLKGVVLYNKAIKQGVFLHTQYAHEFSEESIGQVIYSRDALTSGFLTKYQESLKDALMYIRFPKELYKEVEQLLSFSIDRRKNLALYREIFSKKIAKLQ